MKNKKLLARSVVLGLLCASVFGTSAWAETVVLDIDDGTTPLTYTNTAYNIFDNGTVVKITGTNDKSITFSPSLAGIEGINIGLLGTGGTGILHMSSGETTINGNLYITHYNDPSAHCSIENQYGTLVFNGNILANGIVRNLSSATLKANAVFDIHSGVENDSILSVGLINDGNMLVTGNGKLSVNVYNNALAGASGPYSNYSPLYAIDNRGDLIADAESIIGNIKHNLGANTKINLERSSRYEGAYGIFCGNVLDSDANFSLILNQNTYWEPRHQPGEVEGITLNGASIQLSWGNYHFDEENNNRLYYGWSNDFDTLKLKNVKGTGGYLLLSTDLANDVGDKYEFTGTVPNDFRLGVGIWNKDNNGGVPINREDGHSVTIITAPSNATIDVQAKLGFSQQYSDSFLYSPIIDEVVVGANRNWNFVGWERSGNKTTKTETEQQKDGVELNATELDNTLKRINDIRTDPSEVGVWLRGESGKMKIRSYSYDYSIMSGGYDWDFDSNAAKMFLGFGISYAKNDCDTGIIGNTKSMGYNLYGSWLGKENKDYVDVIVKYGTLDKDYAGFDDNNVFVTGDYDKNLFSIAAKYGRRIEREDGWYFEPSVGLTWGRIGSADYTDSQGIKIHADSSTSKMASLGVQVGKNVKGTEYYGKFEVRHDFDGKMHVSVPGSNLPGSSVYDDMGGTWYKVGIGTARKIDKNNSFYIDIEKDFGNKVKKPYSIGAGYRYTW